MLCVCPQCADQKVTIKFLCKQSLKDDLYNHIDFFHKNCSECDHLRNVRTFIETYNSMPWHILHYNRKVYSIKNEILDNGINVHINKISMGYIRYVGHCLSFGHAPLGRYQTEAEMTMINTIRNRKRRSFGDDCIDLKYLAYRFFSRIFLKRFDNEKAQFMINTLYKIIY